MQAILALIHSYDDFLVAAVLSLPRLHAFITMAGVMSANAVPRLVRNAIVLVLSIPLVPVNIHHIGMVKDGLPFFVFYFAKEYAVGFVLGFLLNWIFWSVTAAGDFMDNQRGAAIASSIDPLQGQETTPLGILFSQTFVTYFYSVGGMLLIVGIAYKSFALWPVTNLYPIVTDTFPTLILGILDLGMRTMFIIAAPAVALMFLAEFALALIGRFAPQIQVFILAMPIKSAVAIFFLIFYIKILFPYAADQEFRFGDVADKFLWMLQAGTEGARK